jgi:hypothetical protein
VWDLGDQSVGVEAAQESSDLSRLLERVVSREDRLGCELAAQVAVGKAMERVLATEEGLEERAIGGRERIEGADRSAIGARGSGGEAIERPNRGRWVIDVSQRVEVARVDLRVDLSVAGQEGDALSRRHPRHHVPSLAAHAPADAELVGLV